ncbi:hypothetical protein [Ralstonia insidiosa]|uniref:hypothetical protein n=1 Tax=Ralstonia insidiosa TaxID=190721 RepID=UPI000CEEE5F1|nr:hypothetical protein [Ralstonia insidiosa]
MIARAIPITPVKLDLTDSLRMAVAEIERFLAMFYPAEPINQTHAAKAIAGQWLSRIKGFHQDDDFLHLVRDFLSYVLSGGERSRISDQLAYYFSGFMPSYGTSCVLVGMLADSRPWSEVQAFMHSQSYGNARQYIESYDWAGGRKRADAEVNAWMAVLREQDTRLQTAMTGEPVLLAFVPPAPTPNGPITDVPVRPPYIRPPVPVVPPEAPPAGPGAQAARRLAPLLVRVGAIPLFIIFITVAPSNLFERNTEDEDLRKMREKYAREQKVPIPDTQQKVDATTDTTNNDCKPQIEENKKNGAVCENDGYVLMEGALKYKRLVNPPKGKGLDGLFEKLPAFDQPAPMPETVTVPKPGKLVFIPAEKKPPLPEYDYVATALKKPAAPTYPKFVVFEAKHIARKFDSTDTEGIKKEAKNRLGNTCDGLQMGANWTVRRIPNALERQYGKKSPEARQKGIEIVNARYARWIFVCLPGPSGGDSANSKLYVLIDVLATDMDLDSTPAKQRTQRSDPDNRL